ncbi:hypothetical protein [Corynebacterium glaucum]|uniref:hypothetical protein n=1 Tax=Corynebacterium glaucum TaxID=187491 RepID=UPI00265863CC|nr:hypothetical protein [Corynebacterium glaucum]
MTSTSARKVAAGVAAVAALAIAACSPPHENPSASGKVDTATSQNPDSLAGSDLAGETSAASVTNVTAAESVRESAGASSTAAAGELPKFNNCDITGVERPISLNLDCKGNKDRLEDIVWDEWTATGATGTATRITVDPERVMEGSTVTLGGPQVVDGELVFTTITVDGKPENPESGI